MTPLLPLEFQKIVEETSVESGFDINYEIGNYSEVNSIITGKAQTELPRFPLIWFIIPYGEIVTIEHGVEANLRFIIATTTKMELTYKQRFQESFDLVLVPIYESFKRRIYFSGMFSMTDPEYVPHERNYLPYWGKEVNGVNVANMFNEPVDVLEIKNLKLLINLNKFC